MKRQRCKGKSVIVNDKTTEADSEIMLNPETETTVAEAR